MVSPAFGQTAPVAITVPAGSVDHAISTVARQARISIGFVGHLPKLRLAGLRAKNVDSALDYIARSAGLVVHRVDSTLYRLERATPVPRPVAGQDPRFDDGPLPEILVTATKRDEALFQLPLSVSVIAMEGRTPAGALFGTDDAVDNLSSVTRTNLGPGRNRIFIRGVADSPFNGPTQSTVGLFLGDARLNFDTPDPDLRLVDIARVEVLKGPQGPLYGSGVLSGVYHIVPNAPEPDRWEGFTSTALGFTAHGGANMAASGMGNLPLAPQLGLRAVAYAERNAGWIDDRLRNDSNINAVRTIGGRLAASWTPADLTIDAIAAGQWTVARDSQYATSDLGRYARATRIAEPHHTNFSSGQIKIARTFGTLEGVVTAALVHHDLANRFDASASPVSVSPDSPADGAVYDEARGQNLLTAEARLADRVGAFQWLFALSRLADRSTLNWTLGAPGESVPDNIYQKSYAELAVFGDVSIALSPQLRAQLGGRVFRTTNEERRPLFGDVERGSMWRANPGAALSWQPDPEMLVWLRYADATRPGGLNPSAKSAPFTYAADRLRSSELGMRAHRFDGRMTLEAAIYRLSWRDIQSDILLNSGLIGTINVGRAHNFGAEILARWTQADWLVEASTTAQFAELYSRSPVIGPIADARLPTVPKLRMHFRAETRLPGFGDHVRGGLTLLYNGPSHLSFDPQLDRPTPAYALAGLYAAWTWHGLVMALSGDNLFNSAADSFAFGNPFSIRTVNQTTPLRPRTWTLSVKQSF